MKLRKILVAVLVCFAGLAQAQMQMPTIPVDPDVRIGKLDNGLTYYIRHNNWPENRANFYIAQKVGSIQEEESQRGLAHFLEHMCFNGTKNFEGNEVMRYCESIGVKFGRDLNAYTSIDQTVYNISNVPTDRQSALDSCLLILHDWASELTLDPKEIDKERGVIHDEWRMRSSASGRMFERNLPNLYPGSKYGQRYPIGLMSVIDNFKPKELIDYYHKWYHPQNQGIIVVGDVDVDHVEAEIKKLFGDIKNPENAAPIVDEPVPDNAEPIVIIDKDKEQRNNMLEVMIKHDVFPDSLKNTMAYMVYQYVKDAAVSMLNNRFTEAALNADCPYVNAMTSDGTYIFAKTKDAFDLGIAPKDMSKTADALKAAFVEARRAAEFGFTATEYERYRQDYLSSLDKQYSNKDKRYNEQFYSQYLGNFLTNEPIPSIDFTYQTMKQVVPMIPVDAVNQVMKELVPANDSNLVILNFNIEKEGNVYPTKEALLGALKAARAEQITAYVDNVKNEPLIAEKPKAGTIKSEKKNDKFGYTELKLSNGATVVLKKTDLKKDQVLLKGESLGGQSLYGESDYVNLKVFDDVIASSGLGAFSTTELSKALAGKIANVNLTSGGHMHIDGSSTPKDVETMMQLLYLYFTNINKDQKSFDNLMKQYEVVLKNRSLSPDVALSDSLTATMYGHNPRLKPLVVEDLPKVSYDRILQIAKERTSNASEWTFTFIGNFDEDSIRPLICQYIASLPVKGKIEKGKVTSIIQKGEIVNEFKRKQETPQATAYMIWHNDKMPYTLENSVRADIAGQVLSMIYLKKIREEESAAYSVGAQGDASIFIDKSHRITLFAYCPMNPDKKELAVKIMNEEVKNLTKTCDESMLKKVKDVMLKDIDDKSKTNNYWLSVIDTYRNNGIDMYTDAKKTIEAQTTQSICDFMKEFLKPGNHISVIMMPE